MKKVKEKNKWKLALIISAILLVVAGVVAAVFLFVGETGEDQFVFAKVDGGYEIASYEGDKRIVTVPSTFKGIKIVGIGANAFSGNDRSQNTKIQQVILPSTLKYIDRNAFSGCSSLSSIQIPANVEMINDYAFLGCTLLADFSVENGSKLNNVGMNAFFNTLIFNKFLKSSSTFLIESGVLLASKNLPSTELVLNSSVRVVAADAFRSQNFVESKISVTEGSVLFAISDFAFSGCKNVATFDFSKATNLSFIGKNAFYNLEGLNTVLFSSNPIQFGSSVFSGCNLKNISISGNSTNLISAFAQGLYTSLDLNITVFGNLTSTFETSFSRFCTSLVIDSSVQSLTNQNVDDFKHVRTLVAPAKALSFVSGSFGGVNPKLRNLTLTGLGNADDVFSTNCSVVFPLLSTVQIEEGVSAIEDDSFSNCTSLATVQFGDSGFDFDMFSNFGVDVFFNTPWLSGAKAAFRSGNTNYGTNFFVIGKVLIDVNNSNSIIELDNSIEKIDRSAFLNNASTVSTVVLGQNVKVINDFAFENCSQISDIFFKLNEHGTHSLESIGNFVFADCSSLELFGTLVFEDGTFFDNGSALILDQIKFCGKSAFDGTPWFDSFSEEFVVFGSTCVLSYAGNFSENFLSLPESTRVIAQSAFEFFSETVTSVFVPDSVVFIGENAFKGVSSIEYVSIGSSVEAIQAGAFDGCENISLIVLFSGSFENLENTFNFNDFSSENVIIFVNNSLVNFYQNIFQNFAKINVQSLD